jgi:hypothetical protein
MSPTPTGLKSVNSERGAGAARAEPDAASTSKNARAMRAVIPDLLRRRFAADRIETNKL